MSTLLDDKRVVFFLEHRDDILEWAAIEGHVTRAVRYLLRDSQAELERRIRAIDPEATTIRLDYLRWERIVARRPEWPPQLGITIEWEPKKVDPFGGALPKLGVFFVPSGKREEEEKVVRDRLLAAFRDAGGFAEIGFEVGRESVWPILRYVPKSRDWWRDAEGWVEAVIADLVRVWERAAPVIEATISEASAS